MRRINRTQSRFSESFFPVYRVRFFLFRTALYGLTNITFQIPQDSLSESLLEGKTVILWDELREDKAVSEKTSFQFLTEDISFFTLPSMGFQISLSKFHKNSRSERLLEGKTVTLWDELTEHKAVSQKASFQFLTENISFFTIALNGIPNITVQIPQELS